MCREFGVHFFGPPCIRSMDHVYQWRSQRETQVARVLSEVSPQIFTHYETCSIARKVSTDLKNTVPFPKKLFLL